MFPSNVALEEVVQEALMKPFLTHRTPGGYQEEKWVCWKVLPKASATTVTALYLKKAMPVPTVSSHWMKCRAEIRHSFEKKCGLFWERVSKSRLTRFIGKGATLTCCSNKMSLVCQGTKALCRLWCTTTPKNLTAVSVYLECCIHVWQNCMETTW